MEGWLAKPIGMAPTKGVLVAHQWMGLGEYEKMRAEEMAKQGYAALALDVYGKGNRCSDFQCAMGTMQTSSEASLIRPRIAAALAVLKHHAPEDKLVGMGYCFGGRMMMELARFPGKGASEGATLQAVASFHGSYSPFADGETAAAGTIVTDVQIHHASGDDHAGLRTIEDEIILGVNGTETVWESAHYWETAHGWTEPGADVYSAREANESHASMLAFFTHSLEPAMPSCMAATDSDVTVVASAVEYSVGDFVMEGWLAKPIGMAPTKGVLVAHQWMGLGEYEKMRAEEMAKQGYAALALDVYGKGNRCSDFQCAMGTMQTSSEASLIRPRIAAALAVLKHHAPEDKLVGMGYCFGGRMMMELARFPGKGASEGATLQAVASFHGSYSPFADGETAAAGTIVTDVQIHHASGDDHAGLRTIEDEIILGVNGTETVWESAHYWETAHGWTEPGAAVYSEREAIESHAAMMAFFSHSLGEVPTCPTQTTTTTTTVAGADSNTTASTTANSTTGDTASSAGRAAAGVAALALIWRM